MGQIVITGVRAEFSHPALQLDLALCELLAHSWVMAGIEGPSRGTAPGCLQWALPLRDSARAWGQSVVQRPGVAQGRNVCDADKAPVLEMVAKVSVTCSGMHHQYICVSPLVCDSVLSIPKMSP